MSTEQEILKLVKSDVHTEYMHCAQYADWIPMGFGYGIIDAFIVQEINLEMEIDERVTSSHYFEAWHMKEDICEKRPDEDSHDLFCIGHPLDLEDVLKKSIGHRGSALFTPRVFIVRKEDSLYNDIRSWPTDVVQEAKDLHAVYYSEEVAQKIKYCREYYREPFFHEWDFIDKEKIFKVVLDYCNTNFHRNKKEEKKFNITIDDLFPEDIYSEVKQQVIDTWKYQ